MFKTTWALAAALIFSTVFSAVLGTVLGTTAHAQDRDPAAVPLNVVPPKKPHPFTVGFRESFYLANKESLLGAKHFEEITMRVRGQSNSDFLSAGIDIGASFGLNVPDYLSIYAPEGYFKIMLGSTPSANSPRVTFGRKKDRWSLLDSFWELGTWQPQYRWDYLRPEEQGLVGLFLEIPTESVRFLFFVSPLYVPESGASYRLRDGKLVSSSPWFFEPTEQIAVNKGLANVRYTPNIPPIEEVIRQGSFGGSIEAGARSAGLWARSSYIYKPRNQLALPFTGNLNVSGTGSFVDVQLYPKVPFHHLASLDFGFKGEKFSLWMSNLYDKPIEEEYPLYNYQKLYPTYFASPGIEFSDTRSNGTSYGVVVSYLSKSGDEPREFGNDVNPDNPTFGLPYNFTNAARAAVRLSFPLNGDLRSSWSLAYTYNIDDSATWIKFVSDWMLSEKFNASFEADLIGSTAPRSDNHFLSRYRGNDRVIASGTMVF